MSTVFAHDVPEVAADGATPGVDSLRWPADWTDRVTKAIQALADLPSNWDSYGAHRVDPRSIHFAVRRIRQISSNTTVEPHVSATPSGHVVLTWTWGNDSGEFQLEFLADGHLDFMFADDEIGIEREEKVSKTGDVLGILDWISQCSTKS